jgi:hypothetical protein
MKHLLWALAAILALFAVSLSGDAQTPPSTTKPTVPSFVTNPWGNPVLSYYDRRREMKEKLELERSIQQLQKLEILKAGRTAAPKEGEELPKGSTTYKSDAAGSAKVTKTPKTPMKGADAPATVTEPATMPKAGRTSVYSKTFSNYDKLINKNK